jgi:hypothetical protein
VNSSLRKVALQFFEPLPFKPGEIGADEAEAQEEAAELVAC